MPSKHLSFKLFFSFTVEFSLEVWTCAAEITDLLMILQKHLLRAFLTAAGCP
jgi:hypothetical protein